LKAKRQVMLLALDGFADVSDDRGPQALYPICILVDLHFTPALFSTLWCRYCWRWSRKRWM